MLLRSAALRGRRTWTVRPSRAVETFAMSIPIVESSCTAPRPRDSAAPSSRDALGGTTDARIIFPSPAITNRFAYPPDQLTRLRTSDTSSWSNATTTGRVPSSAVTRRRGPAPCATARRTVPANRSRCSRSVRTSITPTSLDLWPSLFDLLERRLIGTFYIVLARNRPDDLATLHAVGERVSVNRVMLAIDAPDVRPFAASRHALQHDRVKDQTAVQATDSLNDPHRCTHVVGETARRVVPVLLSRDGPRFLCRGNGRRVLTGCPARLQRTLLPLPAHDQLTLQRRQNATRLRRGSLRASPRPRQRRDSGARPTCCFHSYSLEAARSQLVLRPHHQCSPEGPQRPQPLQTVN